MVERPAGRTNVTIGSSVVGTTDIGALMIQIQTINPRQESFDMGSPIFGGLHVRLLYMYAGEDLVHRIAAP